VSIMSILSMKKSIIKNLASETRGIAMTETALLCFFLYVPVLMMVIIWGDMTLDKTRAHIAAAYVAFSGREPDTSELQNVFFPGADDREDGLGAIRSARVEDSRLTAGPRYELPHTRTGDYSVEHPPDYDLQYRLYSMAMGHMWVTPRVDVFGGEVNMRYRIHQTRSSMARYLSANRIVSIGSLPRTIDAEAGETVEIDTGVDSRAYTAYVEVLTNMLNDGLTGGPMPRGESEVVWSTRLRSPFFRELEREYDRPGRAGGLIGDGLPDFFEMQFGPPDLLRDPWRDDDSFHTGYAYLRNAPLPAYGYHLLGDLGRIGDDGVLPETREMFRKTVEGRDINPGNMPMAHSEFEDHTMFLEPGDPRGRRQGD